MITARFVRSLYAPKGYTYITAAKALGISTRAMRRYVSNGKGWRKPPMPVLLALRALGPRGLGGDAAGGQTTTCDHCGRTTRVT